MGHLTPSTKKSNEDRASWEREREALNKLMSKAELDLEWFLQQEEELHKVKKAEAAERRNVDERFIAVEESKKRARDALLSPYHPKLREQYECDRAKRQRGGSVLINRTGGGH